MPVVFPDYGKVRFPLEPNYAEGGVMEHDPEAWKAVYSHARERAKDLKMTLKSMYEATELSESSWLKMRNDGTPVASDLRRIRIEDGLRWEPGSIEKILGGGAPVALPAEGQEPEVHEVLLEVRREFDRECQTSTVPYRAVR